MADLRTTDAWARREYDVQGCGLRKIISGVLLYKNYRFKDLLQNIYITEEEDTFVKNSEDPKK